MGKCIDLTGQRFGSLTVIKRVENTSANKAQWLCKCDCGEEIVEVSSPLRTGRKTCCVKCKEKEKKKIPYRKDLTGQKFNRLTVIRFNEEYTFEQRQIKSNAPLYWLCECECGNQINVSTASLNNGAVKSCGCLQKEMASNLMKTIQPKGAASRFIDLTGQKFGKLTVIGRDTENTLWNKPQWICKCECGNIKSIPGELLRNGSVSSCGCLGLSKGEYIIKELLLNNNISFQQEYKFKDLKDIDYLRYDFAIFNETGEIIKLIEFDGRQHFDKNSLWYNEDLIKRDLLKTEYAKNNNIPLIRIPYTDIDKISLKYLGIVD